MSDQINLELLPVWRCSQVNICGKQWADSEPRETCPFCHLGPIEPTGFTYGEAKAAWEHFDFEKELPIHLPIPVPQLVNLTILPVGTWVGLPVFHPMAQDGFIADWRVYDIGVIVEVLINQEDAQGEYRCRFLYSIGDFTGTFIYSAQNLWVPERLAKTVLEQSPE